MLDPANGGHGVPRLCAPYGFLHFSLRIVGDRTDGGENFAVIWACAKGVLEMSKGQPPDRRDWLVRAAEALEKACKMKPGAERNEA